MSTYKNTRVSLPEESRASSEIPAIVVSEPSSRQACTEQEDINKQWFVVNHIYATASQRREPLDLEAYKGSVGKGWEEPIDNVFDAIVKRGAGPDPLSPEDETILQELRLRNEERMRSQFALFEAGYRWDLKSGFQAVEQGGSLPVLSNDFSLQILLKHMPEAVNVIGPHNRKTQCLATNFTDFDIHHIMGHIMGHIEEQPVRLPTSHTTQICGGCVGRISRPLKRKAKPSMTLNWIPETFFRASSSGPRLTNGFKGHEELFLT
jgi:hypothetical protein